MGNRTQREPAELRRQRDRRRPWPTLPALLVVGALFGSGDATTRTNRTSFDSNVLRGGSVDLAVDIGAAAFWELSREGNVLFEVLPARGAPFPRPAMIEVHLRRPGVRPGLAGDLLRSLERTGPVKVGQLLARWRRGEGRASLPASLVRRCAEELVARGAMVEKSGELSPMTARMAFLRDVAGFASAQWRQFQSDGREVTDIVRRDCERAIRPSEGSGAA